MRGLVIPGLWQGAAVGVLWERGLSSKAWPWDAATWYDFLLCLGSAV